MSTLAIIPQRMLKSSIPNISVHVALSCACSNKACLQVTPRRCLQYLHVSNWLILPIAHCNYAPKVWSTSFLGLFDVTCYSTSHYTPTRLKTAVQLQLVLIPNQVGQYSFYIFCSIPWWLGFVARYSIQIFWKKNQLLQEILQIISHAYSNILNGATD